MPTAGFIKDMQTAHRNFCLQLDTSIYMENSISPPFTDMSQRQSGRNPDPTVRPHGLLCSPWVEIKRPATQLAFDTSGRAEKLTVSLTVSFIPFAAVRHKFASIFRYSR